LAGPRAALHRRRAWADRACASLQTEEQRRPMAAGRARGAMSEVDANNEDHQENPQRANGKSAFFRESAGSGDGGPDRTGIGDCWSGLGAVGCRTCSGFVLSSPGKIGIAAFDAAAVVAIRADRCAVVLGRLRGWFACAGPCNRLSQWRWLQCANRGAPLERGFGMMAPHVGLLTAPAAHIAWWQIADNPLLTRCSGVGQLHERLRRAAANGLGWRWAYFGVGPRGRRKRPWQNAGTFSGLILGFSACGMVSGQLLFRQVSGRGMRAARARPRQIHVKRAAGSSLSGLVAVETPARELGPKPPFRRGGNNPDVSLGRHWGLSTPFMLVRGQAWPGAAPTFYCNRDRLRLLGLGCCSAAA